MVVGSHDTASNWDDTASCYRLSPSHTPGTTYSPDSRLSSAKRLNRIAPYRLNQPSVGGVLITDTAKPAFHLKENIYRSLKDAHDVNRRQFLHVAAVTGAGTFAGCVGDVDPTGSVSPSPDAGDADRDGCATDTSTHDGPQSSYDSLMLYRMPEYVTEYSDSVVVEYGELGSGAKRAVEQALASDEEYRECIDGEDGTDVMALFSHIERRWEQTGRESFEHTYLLYEGNYYGITLVQEGDFIRVKSIPCTAEACPTTPTPPS